MSTNNTQPLRADGTHPSQRILRSHPANAHPVREYTAGSDTYRMTPAGTFEKV